MTDEHPNIAVLKRFNPANLAESADVLAEDVVWHYYNPHLPDLQGDYVGRAGVLAVLLRSGWSPPLLSEMNWSLSIASKW
jgi:hypothetical protein